MRKITHLLLMATFAVVFLVLTLTGTLAATTTGVMEQAAIAGTSNGQVPGTIATNDAFQKEMLQTATIRDSGNMSLMMKETASTTNKQADDQKITVSTKYDAARPISWAEMTITETTDSLPAMAQHQLRSTGNSLRLAVYVLDAATVQVPLRL